MAVAEDRIDPIVSWRARRGQDTLPSDGGGATPLPLPPSSTCRRREAAAMSDATPTRTEDPPRSRTPASPPTEAEDWPKLRTLLHPEALIATFSGGGRPVDPELALRRLRETLAGLPVGRSQYSPGVGCRKGSAGCSTDRHPLTGHKPSIRSSVAFAEAGAAWSPLAGSQPETPPVTVMSRVVSPCPVIVPILSPELA